MSLFFDHRVYWMVFNAFSFALRWISACGAWTLRRWEQAGQRARSIVLIQKWSSTAELLAKRTRTLAIETGNAVDTRAGWNRACVRTVRWLFSSAFAVAMAVSFGMFVDCRFVG